jgi:hypothetical protein
MPVSPKEREDRLPHELDPSRENGDPIGGALDQRCHIANGPGLMAQAWAIRTIPKRQESDIGTIRKERMVARAKAGQGAKPMPSKADATNARRGNHSMDPAMKAGIGATACSVLIVALVLLAMHVVPVSNG